MNNFPILLAFKKNLLFLGVCLSIVLSIILNTYLLESLSIRLDEAQSIWVGIKPIEAIMEFVAGDMHVPLYMIILHFWMQIFGINIVTIRLLSLFFFILTLPFLYILVKEISNNTVALFTLMFFSLSPFVVWYANEGRMYTLFALLTTLNHFFFLRLRATQGKKAKFGYTLSSLLGLYTHYFFIFLLISQTVFILVKEIIAFYKQKNISFNKLLQFLKVRRHFLVTYILLIIFLMFFFTPWVIYVISIGSIANSEPLIPKPTSYNIFQMFVNFIVGFQDQILQSVFVSLWPILVIIFFFIFTQKQKMFVYSIQYFLATTFLPVIITYLISYIHPIFLPRYLIFVTPGLFFILAWLCVSYFRLPKKSLIIFYFIFTLFLLRQNISVQTPVKEDYKNIVLYLQRASTTKDIILATAPFTIYPIEYDFRKVVKIDTIPKWDRYVEGRIPQFSLSSFAKQMKTYSGKYHNAFVVFSYDQGYEKKIRLYLDTHYQLTRFIKFPPQSEVRVYKLRYDID